MSNPVRYTYQFHNSFVPNLTALYLHAAIGVSGAPTINALKSMGIDSVSRVSAGKYLVTLNKKYQGLRMLNAVFEASGGAAAPDVTVDTNAVAASGTITILTQAGGVNTDPAPGEIMKLEIMLKDSSVAAG